MSRGGSILKVVLGNMEVSYVIGEEEVCNLDQGHCSNRKYQVLLMADDGGENSAPQSI